MTVLMDRLAKLALGIGTGATLGITGIVGWQVFARYVLNSSPSWSEPAALLLMLYAIFFAGAWGVRNDLHLGFGWFVQRRSELFQRRAAWVTEAGVCLLGLMMLWYGAQMAATTWGYSLPGLPISLGWRYLPLVLGGLLIALFSLDNLSRRIKGKR